MSSSGSTPSTPLGLLSALGRSHHPIWIAGHVESASEPAFAQFKSHLADTAHGVAKGCPDLKVQALTP